ncbi:protein HEXIM-like [Odontomachus brunneus]|uniref:protein HEXIM-like n=1 Tax=Odontomachus brunneus TaxID=486640 RepID=UPI0013F21DE9|nr:protein HEXIM-like [Odontomachus brunneus]XP_032681557.1 protein HEXIM-like [Odontomachus brunneus]
MEIHRPERTAEKVSGGIDGDAMGVTAEPMPAASSLPVPELVPQSIGENTNNVDYAKMRVLRKTYGRLESGSGSGDQDGGQHEDSIDIAAKKRRTRRGKPKHRKLKPYSKQQLSCQQQVRSRCVGQMAKTGRQPPAPYNTTQFLMADHSDLPDLEQKLSGVASLEIPAMFQKPSAPPRTRDSSFSVDSDEDYFYSSPEDEEEFLTKEFSNAYEDLHAERLNNLSKSQLIQEYLQLETRMDLLSKRQRMKNMHPIEERDTENKIDPEMAKKLKMYQQRIDDLLQQNEQLKRENEMLHTKKRLRASSSESSVDSESDSDSSSNSNQTRCSCSPSSPGTSPKNAHKPRLDNFKADSKEDSFDVAQNDSPRTCTTPTNLSNGHMIMNETKSYPT